MSWIKTRGSFVKSIAIVPSVFEASRLIRMDPIITFAGPGSGNPREGVQPGRGRKNGQARGHSQRESASFARAAPFHLEDELALKRSRGPGNHMASAAASAATAGLGTSMSWQQQEMLDREQNSRQGPGPGRRPKPQGEPQRDQWQGHNTHEQRPMSGYQAPRHQQQVQERPQSAQSGQSLNRQHGSGPQGQGQQQPRGGQGLHGRGQQQQQQQKQPPMAGEPTDPKPAPVPKPVNFTALQYQSDTRFDSLPISPLTKRAMAEVFGYEMCTKVQAQALPVCLTGTDVLAKAKTGTGKTLAFMIPALEDMFRNPPRPGQVGVLVLSPTRELAMQIHAETVKLLTYHKMRVEVVIGGTNINSETRRLKANAPHVLVATPGRCLDHLSNDVTGLSRMTQDLRMLVLDEADNILDMGFRPALEKILALIPNKSQRQTLLFSATFPHNVKELAKFAMRPSYEMVDTVGEDTTTNVQVEQMSCVAPHADLMPYLCAVIKTHMQQDTDFKVIVFFPTARMTQLYSEVFIQMGFPILEMHSRKSQAVRTRMSEEFRTGTKVIMFSSDVSARGVDYPDVGLVVQVGLPTDKAQYVHRVGRTARAGKTGQSLLLLADFESGFLNKLQGLPIRNMGQLSPAMLEEDSKKLRKALTNVSPDTKGKAYAAWLGFYKSAPGLGMSVDKVVGTANEFSRIIGCIEPPELEAKTVGKMGLKGVPGLRVAGKGLVGAKPSSAQGDRPPSGQYGRPPSAQGGRHGGGGGGGHQHTRF